MTIEDIEDGLNVSMSQRLYKGLTELFLSDFNMTLEESLRSFVEWCVKESEAFKKWALAENM